MEGCGVPNFRQASMGMAAEGGEAAEHLPMSSHPAPASLSCNMPYMSHV